jgi:TATA-box binding protein (TBP) (component of TFIID and TFIIIB)
MDYSVSTITICALSKSKVSLNLYNIANFIPINDEIIGLQYKFKDVIRRGNYTSKKTSTFHNQISMIVNTGKSTGTSTGKNINVKIFSNGSLHLSGCNDTINCQQVIDILNKYYKELQDMYCNSPVSLDNNNVPVNETGNVLSLGGRQVIGYKSWDDYIINGEHCVYNNLGFVSKKMSKNRMIYNLDGGYIGEKVMVLPNNIYYRSYTVSDDNIKNGSGNIIGRIETRVHCREGTTFSSFSGLSNFSIVCSPFKENTQMDTEMEYEIIPSCINIKFKLPVLVNRIKVAEKLGNSPELVVKYTPEFYSGIKCIFKKKVGKVTFIIFSSGCVIASGFKSFDEITRYKKKFQDILIDQGII